MHEGQHVSGVVVRLYTMSEFVANVFYGAQEARIGISDYPQEQCELYSSPKRGTGSPAILVETEKLLIFFWLIHKPSTEKVGQGNV